ncbi:serine protease [Bacillus cereus]|uniref:trypsin-like serine peptidase n=1 Tax=Bacillus TaxID=1386 RepID=UPI002B24BFAE|nr:MULTISPECIES: serine protease [Bacillus]MEB2589473.1 serine protease [Bacillus cereus]MEB2641905.1 serine protease [Bacillus sp. DAG6]
MLDSFISIRCRLALYSFGVLFIFFCTVFLVNQKVYAEDVPWTSVSNEGERVLFQEQSLYSNDRRGEDLVSPSFEGRKHGGEDWGAFLENTKLNYSPNILTYSVIGIDDRIRVNDTTSYPYSAVVHIATQYNSGEIYGCTGALISKDTVLTAGHCIYNKEIGGWTDNENSNYDYGTIKLNGSPGDYTGWFGYRTTYVESPKGLLAVIPGYPADKIGNERYTMWRDYGPIEGVNPSRLTYKIDTYEGQSGSPVYHYFDTGIKIIAIHTRGNKNMNFGNRITDNVFNNIKRWSE